MKKHLSVFSILTCFVLIGGSQLLVQAQDNLPSAFQLLPEVIWSSASGGGNWASEIQITCRTGGTTAIQVWFFYGGGNFRGPITIWTNPSNWDGIKYNNILQYLGGIDTSFNYYNRVGALEVYSSNSDVKFTCEARTYNGNLSKSFPGLNFDNDSTRVRYNAGGNVTMCISNLENNSTYRSAIGFFNPTATSIDILIYLMNASAGGYSGTLIYRTIASFEFLALDPFSAAGVGYPTYSYDNMYVYITPQSGETGIGYVMPFGATSNNISNDPASHLAKNFNPTPPPDPSLVSKADIEESTVTRPPGIQKNSKKK